MLAEIAISPANVRLAAPLTEARLGHSAALELKVLVLHGILHLAGFDHERDNGKMARKEAILRRELRLPLSLTERGEPDGREPETSYRRSGSRSARRTAYYAVIFATESIGILTLVSYVDRYRKPENFCRAISRTTSTFSNARSSQSEDAQACVSYRWRCWSGIAAIAVLIGYLVFRYEDWNIYEVLQAVIGLLLVNRDVQALSAVRVLLSHQGRG